MENRFTIGETAIQAVMEKLIQLPYKEVAEVIGKIQQDVKPLEEPRDDEPEK